MSLSSPNHNIKSIDADPSLFYSIVSSLRFPAIFQNTTVVPHTSWKFYLFLVFLSIVLLHLPYVAFVLQRCFNVFREICSCDLIYLIRRFDFIEGFMLYFSFDKTKEWKYFICRSLCPY